MPVTVPTLSPLTRLGVRSGVFFYRFVIWTLRMRMTCRAREFLDSKPTSSLFLAWHNRGLFALCGFARYGRNIPLTGLVSASGDGALMAEAMGALGLPAARGSSSRRAVEAIRELIAVLESGRNVVITPDGPRGPVYTVKEGTVDFGRGHAKAIYLLGFSCSKVWRFNSWDKYMIPKPFALLEFDVEKIDMDSPFDVAILTEKLTALNKDAG